MSVATLTAAPMRAQTDCTTFIDSFAAHCEPCGIFMLNPWASLRRITKSAFGAIGRNKGQVRLFTNNASRSMTVVDPQTPPIRGALDIQILESGATTMTNQNIQTSNETTYPGEVIAWILTVDGVADDGKPARYMLASKYFRTEAEAVAFRKHVKHDTVYLTECRLFETSQESLAEIEARIFGEVSV